MAHPDSDLAQLSDDELEVAQFGIDVILQTMELERQLLSCSSALVALSNRTIESKSLTLALKLSTTLVFTAKELLAASIQAQSPEAKNPYPLMAEVLRRSLSSISLLADGLLR